MDLREYSRNEDADVDTTGYNETSLNEEEPPDVIENQKPAWARCMDMPEGITTDNIADADTLKGVKQKCLTAIGSTGLRPNLESQATKVGHLFVRWGGRWIQLTWKNNPKKYIVGNSLIKGYGGVSFARAIGNMPERQAPASARNLSDELEAAGAAPGPDLLEAYARLRRP